MAIHNWIWVAVDRVVGPEGNALLFRIEIPRAQKTWPPGNRLRIDCCSCTCYTMRDVPDEYVKPVDSHGAGLCLLQSRHAAGQARPNFKLVLEQQFDFVDHLQTLAGTFFRRRASISTVRTQSL